MLYLIVIFFVFVGGFSFIGGLIANYENRKIRNQEKNLTKNKIETLDYVSLPEPPHKLYSNFSIETNEKPVKIANEIIPPNHAATFFIENGRWKLDSVRVK